MKVKSLSAAELVLVIRRNNFWSRNKEYERIIQNQENGGSMQQNEHNYGLTMAEQENCGIVLSALRTFRGKRRSHLAYVGMPITTGKRYYDVLTKEGVKNREELKAKLGPEALWHLIVEPNICEGIKLADNLGAQKNLLFIAPSVFNASQWQWSQHAYMTLWYNVIAELVGAHYVMDGWEYSLGGLREVFFSMMLQWRYIRWYNKDQAIRIFGLESLFLGLTHQQTQQLFEDMWKMRIYDSHGKEISIDTALSMSVSAICDLKDRGFDCQDLIGIAWSLQQLPILSPFCGDGPSNWETDTYFNAQEKLSKLVGTN